MLLILSTVYFFLELNVASSAAVTVVSLAVSLTLCPSTEEKFRSGGGAFSSFTAGA